MNLTQLCPSAEVVVISAAPLDRRFPSGFAGRHAAFTSAVAQRLRTELIYVHDGDKTAFGNASLPKGITEVHVVDGSATDRLDDARIPRQSVARRMRFSSGGKRPLVVTLTASVAQTALNSGKTISVLEEGWERLLPQWNPSPRQKALNLAERFRYGSLYRRIGRSAVRVVAITPRESRHFARFMPEDRICVIPYGVDTHYFEPILVPERDIDLLVVGAVNRSEQRVEELVRQLQRHPATLNARCVLVGGSPRLSIQNLASPTVEIAGYVSDVRPYYARAKVVVVPAVADLGIRTTMLQAWAMERPVVTSNLVLEASEHGAFQSQLAVTSIAAMAPVIARLLGDANERERLGRLARLVVVKHHEEKRSANQFASLVEQALADNPIE